MKKSIVIYGGGLAGSQLAHTLQHDADVTLVSPLDYFEVPMALPRALVEPKLSKRSVMSLTQTLPKVRHVQGKLVRFDAGRGIVETTDGKSLELNGDISVLATGSSYANSLTRAQTGTVDERRKQLAGFADRLEQAQNILIVGGGPIGIELAGEITLETPGKNITVVESNAEILRGTSRKVAARALSALKGRGVSFGFLMRTSDQIGSTSGERFHGKHRSLARGEDLQRFSEKAENVRTSSPRDE